MFDKLTREEKWILVGSATTFVTTSLIIYIRARRRAAQLGSPPQLIDKRTSPEGMTVKHYYDAKMPIEERVKLLQKLVEDGVKDPGMRQLALAITNKCPARDEKCEAKAIYDWVRTNIRYTGDIAPIKLKNGQIEGVDLFQSPRRTVQFKGGDCDDAAVLTASLLSLNGIAARFAVTTAPGAGKEDYSHIYVEYGYPKNNPKRWFPVDSTLPGNHFEEAARYGRKLNFPA